MKLRINPLVAEDLKEINSFIAEDNAEKALETVRKIMWCFTKLEKRRLRFIG
jgi:plasmid stabilization system protein ParE